jgi:Ran GTPase-activating protein (RanGAP) involved in mRNA processing and transport
MNALLSGSRLTDLDIHSNPLGDQGIAFLARALELSPFLTTLTIEDTYMSENGPGPEYIAKAYKANPRLIKLNIAGNQIGADGAWWLADALLKENATALTDLDLSNNWIGDRGVWHLAECLKGNATLANLAINRVRCGDTGASSLSKALEANASLRHLRLDSNVIGPHGVWHLAEALKKNTTLTSLDMAEQEGGIGYYGAWWVAEALKKNSTLTALNIYQNRIENLGASYIADALSSVNITLTELIFGDGTIDDSVSRNLDYWIARNRCGALVLQVHLRGLDFQNMKVQAVNVAGKVVVSIILPRQAPLALIVKEVETYLRNPVQRVALILPSGALVNLAEHEGLTLETALRKDSQETGT